MKKFFFIVGILHCLTGFAQKKMSYEDARLICAQEMSAFTSAVSSAYKTGTSYDQFQAAVCGRWQPAAEGINQLKAAYNYLSKATRPDDIIRSYTGKDIAASLKFLTDLHNKGIESDGSELFGGRTGADDNSFARTAGCRWFQVWCLMQSFASWILNNWFSIPDIWIAIYG